MPTLPATPPIGIYTVSYSRFSCKFFEKYKQRKQVREVQGRGGVTQGTLFHMS